MVQGQFRLRHQDIRSRGRGRKDAALHRRKAPAPVRHFGVQPTRRRRLRGLGTPWQRIELCQLRAGSRRPRHLRLQDQVPRRAGRIQATEQGARRKHPHSSDQKPGRQGAFFPLRPLEQPVRSRARHLRLHRRGQEPRWRQRCHSRSLRHGPLHKILLHPDGLRQGRIRCDRSPD